MYTSMYTHTHTPFKKPGPVHSLQWTAATVSSRLERQSRCPAPRPSPAQCYRLTELKRGKDRGLKDERHTFLSWPTLHF